MLILIEWESVSLSRVQQMAKMIGAHDVTGFRPNEMMAILSYQGPLTVEQFCKKVTDAIWSINGGMYAKAEEADAATILLMM